MFHQERQRMTRTVYALVATVMFTVSYPTLLMAGCNCWDGDYICTIHNEEGDILEVLLFEDFC